MKMRVLVATPTVFSREAWAFDCEEKPTARELRSPWLPLPFSSVVVNLKRSWGTFVKIVVVLVLALDQEASEDDDGKE
jgi:hypothetical protein